MELRSTPERSEPERSKPERGRLVVACGARAAEQRLLDEVLAAHAERVAAFRAGDPGALARPLRIVVPSRSLRQHVNAALVRRAGHSLAALLVQTQRALAHAVLERVGEAPPAGDALLPILVRRYARDEKALAALVDELGDGLRLVEASVRDLLDAGFGAASSEAVEDALADAGELGPVAGERARAVARVTLRCVGALEALGLGHRSSLLVRAREIVAERGRDALPTAALWIHGFADATGLVAEWLEALVRGFAGCVLVDVPPDPADPERREQDFPRPFLGRMELAVGVREVADAPAPVASIECLRAPGSAAELRAVAVRIRRLLDDGGVAPESIGVVARRLEPYRAALHAQFGRLAIPFSVIGGSAGPDAGSRRVAAIVRLLAERERTPIDAWLSADASRESEDADLRVGLHVVGAGRLASLAELDLEDALRGETQLRLPIRRGVSGEEDGGGEAASEESRAERCRNRHRFLPGRRLDGARRRALAVLERLRAWPERTSLAEHRRVFAGLLEELGYRPGAANGERVLDAAEALGSGLSGDLELGREELALLLERALEAAEPPRLGGEGAGVQVLSATHARGWSFEHLFVLGMNRDELPRGFAEDSLLPDALRRRLRDVLPEMPVKERARDEERHLFAELLSSSSRVALVWQHTSDEGRERPESPYVVRLGLLRSSLAAVTAPMLFDASSVPPDPLWTAAPRPAHEHAALAGLRGERSALEPLRALALGESIEALPPAERAAPEQLARVQLSVLEELDPRPRRAQLGPWFGFVGEPSDASAELYATRLQDVARCGWQAFLRRDLGLEPVPDVLDALPAPDALARGLLVHRVLERIARDVLGERAPKTLVEALARGAVPVRWPEASALEALLEEEAREVARDEGVRVPGFATALAASVRADLECARSIDWQDPGLAVLGVELEGELRLSGGAAGERRIRFVADRADRDAAGRLRLTDYKTGKPIDSGARADTRIRNFEKKVAAGSHFQAPAYWLAASALASSAEGRFLFLREGVPDCARVFRVDERTQEIATAFEAAARVVLEAWDCGALGPRLVDISGDEPAACRWCEVSAACLRGESSHRARLREWLRAGPGGDPSSAERALRALQRLGAAPEAEGGS